MASHVAYGSSRTDGKDQMTPERGANALTISVPVLHEGNTVAVQKGTRIPADETSAAAAALIPTCFPSYGRPLRFSVMCGHR
ncbi:hypothetical protein MRX96_012753 [Rhipicephalus microplus]